MHERELTQAVRVIDEFAGEVIRVRRVQLGEEASGDESGAGRGGGEGEEEEGRRERPVEGKTEEEGSEKNGVAQLPVVKSYQQGGKEGGNEGGNEGGEEVNGGGAGEAAVSQQPFNLRDDWRGGGARSDILSR